MTKINARNARSTTHPLTHPFSGVVCKVERLLRRYSHLPIFAPFVWGGCVLDAREQVLSTLRLSAEYFMEIAEISVDIKVHTGEKYLSG